MPQGPKQHALTDSASRWLWIGSYGQPTHRGLYRCRFDTSSGKFVETAHRIVDSINPLFLTFHPNGRFLYAVGDVAQPAGSTQSGRVWVLAICPQTGATTLLQQLETAGSTPCFVSVDQTGQCLLVANYTSGTVATFAIGADGHLSPARSVIAHAGRSVNLARQEASHPHAIIATPDNAFAFSADLGADKIWLYRLNAPQAELTFQQASSAETPAGSGPRHLVFDPAGRFLYVVNELANTVSVFEYHAAAGRLSIQQTIGCLPRDYHQTSYAAEIQVHPSGRFLYVSNRGHDSLAIFSIEPAAGFLTLTDIVPCGGRWPRCFAIDPTGRWLLVACERSDELAVFECDARTGRLRPTGNEVGLPSPGSLAFLPQTV